MTVVRPARRACPHRDRWLASLAAGWLAAVPTAAHANASWVQQADGTLTCTGLLEPNEVVELAAPSPSYEGPPDRARALEYFQGKPTDARQAAYRHLLALSAVAWWANIANDQALRADALDVIRVLADAYAEPSADLVFRQISRCARAQLTSAEMQLGRVDNVALQTTSLLQSLPARLPPRSFEDGPLLVALRELKLAPEARDSTALLATRAVTYGQDAVAAKQPQRASRLLASAADALQSLGDAARARQLAVQSLEVTGTPPAVEASWRAMAPLYDATLALNDAENAAKLPQLLQPDEPPPTLADRRSAFESMRRLMAFAQANKDYATLSRLRVSAFKLLLDVDRDAYSIAFLRHALAGLDSDPDTYDVGFLIDRDPSVGVSELATYTSHVDTLITQAQAQFVADARQMFYLEYGIDRVLHTLAGLYAPMPDSREQIANETFRLAQLRSFGRLTLATMRAELWKIPDLATDTQQKIQLFFALPTQTALWLKVVLDGLRTAPGAAPPEGKVVGPAVDTLESIMSMYGNQKQEWVDFVRKNAPGVAELATPRPLPVSEFQRRLRAHEALVATLVTPQELYVWAITPSAVAFSRQQVGEAEIAAKVQRLRAGLVPGIANGLARLPPFDATAAHELYDLVFKPLEPALRGVTDVVWFGHGALGAVPPAVLVSAPPAKSVVTSAAEFRTTKFLVDRYAFAALADLSLFPWHRDQPLHRDLHAKFLGVGAPLLSAEDVANRSRSRSYELAGGLDGKDLAELPKLEESIDELQSLAAVAGKSRSTLWLGPDASEQKFVGDALIGYRTIALATHGFLPDEIRNVSEPALMLALDSSRKDGFDGLLTSSEIARLRLDADLVILSACNTAGADGRPHADAFTGLSQAFFIAGAHALMVSHWPVMSGAAVELSVGTLERARNPNVPLSRSLQHAMQAVRRSGAASAVESHPSYWGPFVIVGDGR